jgi:dipeptidyl aminopeptidase/acylaminoacyl peptidase
MRGTPLTRAFLSDAALCRLFSGPEPSPHQSYFLAVTMRVQWAVVASVLLVIARPNVSAQPEATLKMRGGPFPRQITLFDREGRVMRTLGEPGPYAQPALSPDGTRLAIVKQDSALPRRPHIWVFEVSTGISRQITFDPAGESAPTWSPDGSQIAFSSRRNNHVGLYRKASDGTGTEELLYQHSLAAQTILTDWSPDGRFLSFHSGGVLYVLPLAGDRGPVELIRDEYEAYAGRFSSDSRFIAYVADETGQNEVYVRAFDPVSARFAAADAKWQVSAHGKLPAPSDGSTPPSSCYEESVCVEPVYWRSDGRELLYVDSDGAVMTADLTLAPTFKTGTPKRLFRAPGAGRAGVGGDYFSSATISRDGQRVAFAVSTPPARSVVRVRPEMLATYVGKYAATGTIGELIVTLEGGQLIVRDPRGIKLSILAESENYFFRREYRAGREDFPVADRDIEFIKSDSGAVTHLFVYFGGPGVKWTRQ